MEITAKKGIKKDEEGNVIEGTEVTINIDLGSDVDSLAAKCEKGMETVYDKAMSQIKVDVQARMRALMIAGKTDAEIQADLETYVPGAAIKRVAVDPLVQIKSKIASGDMSDEERQALVDLLMGD